jgi:transposase
VRRARAIDEFLTKVEEWVEKSKGHIRADRVHERLVPMGYTGAERTTRRVVSELKQRYRDGHRRTYRPWVPEPGLWLQFDWGEGPRIGARRSSLFCAWLAWSRYRVVIPTWDQTQGSLVSCLDTVLRRVGGAPTYLLTDNAKTVTVEHVAGVPVRHPQMVAVGRHYGCTVHTCRPFDPQSKGGAENTVKVAKADLVPTDANLLDSYASFAELVEACDAFGERVNHRTHREIAAVPADRLLIERARLHVLPAEPYALALGDERVVDDSQTIRFGSVRYSTPPGHVGATVWCRVVGEELVVVARARSGLVEIARHELSTPGTPRILDEHFPDHPGGNHPRPPKIRPRSEAEVAFLDLGEGAHQWLVEAAAVGAQRIRSKMSRAIELATILGADRVDQALGLAAAAGRFGDTDLATILDHLATAGTASDLVRADENHSAQPGTRGWEVFGQ